MAGPLIGALRVSLSAETASFEAGMKRAQRTATTTSSSIARSLGSIKTGLAAFGLTLGVGLFANAIKDALEYSSHLIELGQTLGLTAKDLQTFSFAAGQVGVSQEELQTGIQKLTISMGKAQVGAKAQADAFKAIGISVDDLKGKDTGDVFRLIADKLQQVGDRSKRAAVEVALFGKSGAKLDNLLSGAEGRLNDLSAAAEKLGIVLSDEQIRNADRTADKIRALVTVLKAQIASDVANNADAILELANALQSLATMAVNAGNKLHAFFASLSDPKNSILSQFFQMLGPDLQGNYYNPKATVSAKLPPPIRVGKPLALTGDVGNFLAGDKKAKIDHSAEDALRAQHQFEQDLMRANIDILNAKKDLATDYVEQTAIAIQIKDLEKAAFIAEQQYQVALYHLTKGKEGLSQAQADQLIAAYSIKDDLERQAILDDEETKRKEDFNQVTQDYFARRKDVLQAELAIAETAQEQRDIQLRLLDLSYRQEKARLEAVLADEKASFAAKEDARQRLENLNKTRPLDTQAVLQNTRGPLEDYLASLPTTAAKANEALQRLEVEGFNGLIDSVLALSEGVDSATKSLINTLKQFLLGLARIELQRMLGGALQGGGGFGGILGAVTSIFGGGHGASGLLSAAGDTSSSLSIVDLPSFASGGAFAFRGIPGIDKNILSMNGIPIARVSYGEHAFIGNDNHPTRAMGRGGDTFITVNTPDADSFRRNQRQLAREWNRRMKY